METQHCVSDTAERDRNCNIEYVMLCCTATTDEMADVLANIQTVIRT